jgi:hypothetical protein
MKTVFLVTGIALLAVFYFLGDRLGRKKKLPANTIAAGSIFFSIAYAVITLHPEWEVRVFPLEGYLYIRNIWVGWPIMFAFAAVRRSVPSERNRKAIRAFLLILGVYFVFTAALYFIHPDYDTLEGAVDQETGVCTQSTSYTCGACSSVMLLHTLGIETTEAEMARLTDTLYLRGVPDFGIWVGLRRKLRGTDWRVSVLALDYDELMRLGRPCVAGTKFSFMMDHAVCVFKVLPDRIVIGNPLKDKIQILEKAEFLERWRGRAIVVHKGRLNKTASSGNKYNNCRGKYVIPLEDAIFVR